MFEVMKIVCVIMMIPDNEPRRVRSFALVFHLYIVIFFFIFVVIVYFSNLQNKLENTEHVDNDLVVVVDNIDDVDF